MKSLVFLTAMLVPCVAGVYADTAFSIWGDESSVVATSITSTHDNRGMAVGYLYWNPAGINRMAVKFERDSVPHVWTSEYSSLTFSEIGLGFPREGINSEGLIIQLLTCDTSRASKIDRPTSMTECEFVQWVLDKNNSVSQLRSRLDEMRRFPFSVCQAFTACHFRIVDSLQEVMIVEWVDAELKIHVFSARSQLAFANSDWASSRDVLSKDIDLPGTSSLARLVNATRMSKTSMPEVQDAEAILKAVRTDNTAFEIVYNAQEMRVKNLRAHRERAFGLQGLADEPFSKTIDLSEGLPPDKATQTEEADRLDLFFKASGLSHLSGERTSREFWLAQ